MTAGAISMRILTLAVGLFAANVAHARSECGYPELTLGSWQGVFVTAGAPWPIVKQLGAVGQ